MPRLEPNSDTVTFTCWSWSQLKSSNGDDCYRTIIHMQGWQVDRDAITACGLQRSKTVTGESLSDGYDYSDIDVAPADWRGCKRCEAAYRKWSVKQKKVSDTE